MVKVNFYELNTIEDSKLLFAVIMTKYNGRWLYVRHKDRSTWEIPGGHREGNESISETASRELFEETGATKFSLTPTCIYSVERGKNVDYTESFGQLFFADVEILSNQLHFEISSIKLFDEIPESLTYPLIQPSLHNKVLEFLMSMN